MAYSYTVVVNNLYSYNLAVMLLLYTIVGRHYLHFSLFIFFRIRV